MKIKTEKCVVKVTAGNGTYKTSKVRGLSANCTSGPKQAATALARKLYGETFITVLETAQPMRVGAYGTTYWVIKGHPVQQADKP